MTVEITYKEERRFQLRAEVPGEIGRVTVSASNYVERYNKPSGVQLELRGSSHKTRSATLRNRDGAWSPKDLPTATVVKRVLNLLARDRENVAARIAADVRGATDLREREESRAAAEALLSPCPRGVWLEGCPGGLVRVEFTCAVGGLAAVLRELADLAAADAGDKEE